MNAARALLRCGGVALSTTLSLVANAADNAVPPKERALTARLTPSALTPPLPEMKVRWDGKQSTGSGLKTFDSPRFGMTRDGGGRAHAGVDLDAAVGTPVFAVADGVVDLARFNDPLYGADILLAFRPTAAILTYLARTGNPDDDGVLCALCAPVGGVR